MENIRATTKPSSLSLLCIYCAMLLVSSALCEASFVSNTREQRSASVPIGSLKPLQVVDCVLERCMWLSSSRAKRLCTYLLCMHGADSVESMLSPSAELYGEDEDQSTQDMMTSSENVDAGMRDYASPQAYMMEGDDDPIDSRTLIRSKKWQYPDPLQHCVRISCQGQRGADFYTCVYKNCIAAGILKGDFVGV